MTSRRPPELPDLTVIEPTSEGTSSQTMVQHLPVPPEDPAGIDSIHGPAPRRQQKPATPSPPPQPPAPTLPLRTVRALGIPDLLAAKQIADSALVKSREGRAKAPFGVLLCITALMRPQRACHPERAAR
jgi:hypothetical protein